MTTKDYEIKIRNLLDKYFRGLNSNFQIESDTQWPAFPRDKRYSPRVDVAVGPFATERRLIDEYNQLCKKARPFLKAVFEEFENNLRKFNPAAPVVRAAYDNFNRNSRCFLAIEVEKSGSRKHRLGDIVNASALGRIGIIIAWEERDLRSFMRILEYFNFLEDVGKNTFKTKNIAVLTKEQFLSILYDLS